MGINLHTGVYILKPTLELRNQILHELDVAVVVFELVWAAGSGGKLYTYEYKGGKSRQGRILIAMVVVGSP